MDKREKTDKKIAAIEAKLARLAAATGELERKRAHYEAILAKCKADKVALEKPVDAQ